MKIVFFLPDLYGGGAERVMVMLANKFADNHQVYLIIVRKNGDLFNILSNKVNLIVLNNSKVVFSAFSLYKELKNIKPDIVISALDSANIIATLVTKLLKIPNIVTIHDYFSLKYENSILMKNTLKILKLADKIVCVSKGVKQDITKFGIQSLVIYNPSITNISKVTNKENIIISIGRLEKAKNFKLLIDVFNQFNHKYNNYKLYILGKGSLEKELKSYANINKNIYFPGFVDINDYLNKSKIFISSSNREPFGLVLVEAMSYGVNIVATKTDGAKEILEDGKFGKLVDIGDKQEMLKALEKVIQNPIKAEILQEKAKQFLVDNIYLEYEKLIKKVLNDTNN